MARTFTKIIPSGVRNTVRVIQHNLKKDGVSLSASVDLGLKGVGILDYTDSALKFEVSAYEQIDHLKSCKREEETVRWIKTFQKKDVLYDIGANVGVFSLITNSHLRGETTVYAFEPGFPTYAALCKNIYLNNASASVFAFPVALMEATSVQYFKYANLAPGQAKHEMGIQQNDSERIEHIFSQPVLCYTLDDFIRTFKTKPPTHVKIDVDGEERKVLEGAVETLRDKSLRSVLLEIDKKVPGWEVLSKFVTNAGFKVDSENRHKDGTTYNYIFKR